MFISDQDIATARAGTCPYCHKPITKCEVAAAWALLVKS